MAVHVQLVAENQHESLVDLLCEVHAFYNEGAVVSRDVVREHLRQNLLAPGSSQRLVVASDNDGAVVGLAAISLVHSLVDFAPDKRRHCQLKELYVRSASRSHGAGKALVAWVARYSLENGCHRIDWPVMASNDRGIAFYEGLGAKRVGNRLNYRLSEPQISQLAFDL